MIKRVAVIGGGSSGLVAIKCCLDEGFDVVCFERYSDIGGIWNYQKEPEEGRASVYESCVINTSKEMMAYSDFPMPVDFPPFMPHHKLLRYLRMYAKHFDLLQYIRFNSKVKRIKKADDFVHSGRWIIQTESQSRQDLEETFDAVMVCTGHHSKPYRPAFPNSEEFKGNTMHSQAYRTPDCFKDKKVLVVGIGNSAVDIAVDATREASQVFLSTRRGAWVVGRRGLWGLPNDMLANNRALFYTGRTAMQWMVEKMANLACDHEVYGLKASHRGLQAHPTITDDLPNQIITGKVLVRSNIARFTPTGVWFDDGSFEDIDTVVYATGYQYECPFLDSSVLKIDNNKSHLYKYVFPPCLEHPTLAVIGLLQAVGAVMPLAEIQSRWFGQVLKGECKLPNEDEMLADISKKERRIDSDYVHSPRHALETMWVPYMDEVAEQFGAKPDFWQLAKHDMFFAFRCLMGPCVPAQYRLQGPHIWDGAKETIKNAFSSCRTPLTTRKPPKSSVNKTENRINVLKVHMKSISTDRSFLIYLLKFLFCILLLFCTCL